MRKFMDVMNLVYIFLVVGKIEIHDNDAIKNEIDNSCWLSPSLQVSPSHPPCIGTYLHFDLIPLYINIKHILNTNMSLNYITNK